jgi:hypothetical protein
VHSPTPIRQTTIEESMEWRKGEQVYGGVLVP